MERIKTYISGFDKLIEGGIPKGSCILLSGEAGTGKTIFSLEYIYRGAINNEVSIYFTFEERRKSIIEQAKQFNFDIEKFENNNLLKIISIGTDDISSNTIKDILEIVVSTKAKRIVIDSITTLSFITPENLSSGSMNVFSIKKFLYHFITELSAIEELTSICISQKDEAISNNIAEYLCDGVIVINPQKLGSEYNRTLCIKKMRRTKNDDNRYPMEISPKGIIIHSNI
jgi:KaiC/GvpD/RAD55 family RecA-like ATPase